MGIVCQKLEKGTSLPLTNNGDLQIFFLSTGSDFDNNLAQPNYIIIKGDTHILVNFGMDGPLGLHEVAGLGMEDIKVCLPTQSGGDHVSNISRLALMNKLSLVECIKKERLNMVITAEMLRTKNSNDFIRLFEIFQPKRKTKIPREIFEINYRDIHIELFRTKHHPDTDKFYNKRHIAYGLFVDNKVLITADTCYDFDLHSYYGNKAEYIFHKVKMLDTNILNFVNYPTEWKAKTFFYQSHNDFRGYYKKTKDYAGLIKSGHVYTIN